MNGTPLIERTFDNQNRETTRTAGSNIQSQLHDRYGCLIKRKWQGQQRATRRYRWDAENRLEATEDSLTGSTHYQRDSQGQLTQENDTEYHYDLGGNRVPEGGQLQQDRLITTATDKRGYDALGAEIRITGQTTEHRTFDAEGQLIEFKQPELHITYGYDALGRRAWRKTDAGTTTYLWHNDVLLGEQSPKGDWQWYLRDPKTDEPLITLIDNQPYYYELDHRMMPVRLWDQSGQKVWEGHADAWGKCQPETLNNSIHQPLRLPGQFEDELTGIVQNRFRDYDPATGRYLTPDPLGVQGGLNTYRYTRNPVDYIDPLGLSSCETSGVTPEDAMKGEDGPVGDDGPAFQNIELAGAAALARAPAPVPTPPTSIVPRVITGAAANDAVYAVERSLFSRVLPALGTAATFVTGMLYSPELGGGLEQISAPDGTVYSKHRDERIWNAAGVNGTQWQTASPQEDMEYRTWLANGGTGSFQDWVSHGKPSDLILAGGSSIASNGLMSVSESDRVLRQKTKDYLGEIDEKIQSGELSKKDVGPVVAGVIDRRTGEFFSAYNNRHGEAPDPLHPLLKPRVEEMQADPQHPSSAGSHAEIIALNEALVARGSDVTEDQLSEFTMLPLWKKGSGNGKMKAGEPAPRCGNCAQISSGVRNLSGDAPPLFE